MNFYVQKTLSDIFRYYINYTVCQIIKILRHEIFNFRADYNGDRELIVHYSTAILKRIVWFSVITTG